MEKRLSRASIKKILESKPDGSREGGYITEDGGYVSNGAFLIKNVFNFNGDLKLSKMHGFTRKNANSLIDKTKLCKIPCTFLREETSETYPDMTLAIFSDKTSTKVVHINKKYLQVIFQSSHPNEKVDISKTTVYIREDFDINYTVITERNICSYFGLPVMPIKQRS